MLMANATFNWPHSQIFGNHDDDEDYGMSIDIRSLFDILEESLMENSQVGLSGGNILRGSPAPDISINQTFQLQSECQVLGGEPSLIELPQPSAAHPPYNNSEALVSRKGYSDVLLDPAGNSRMVVDHGRQENLAQFPSIMHTCSGNHENQYRQVSANNNCCNGMDGVSEVQIPSCRRESSFRFGGSDQVSDKVYNGYPRGGLGTQFGQVKRESHSICTKNSVTENLHLNSQSIGATEDPMHLSDPSLHLDAKAPDNHIYEETIPGRNNDMVEPRDRDLNAGSSSKMELIACGGSSNYFSAISGSKTNFEELNYKFDGGNIISPTIIDSSFFNCKETCMDDRASLQPLTCDWSYKSRNMRIRDEQTDELAGPRMTPNSVGFLDESINLKGSNGNNEIFFIGKDANHSLRCSFPSITRQRDNDSIQDGKEVTLSSKRAHIINGYLTDSGSLSLNASGIFPFKKPRISTGNQMGSNESEGKLIPSTGMEYDFHRGPESVQSDSSGSRFFTDYGSGIRVIEHTSEHTVSNQSIGVRKSFVNLPYPTSSDPCHHEAASMRKAYDERLIYQAALQDLSQPSSEETLPDGLLAVPLLRHQRIALSWMVQKETSSSHCSGGILADDQGLGKTVSTIALILKEKPPCNKARPEDVKKDEHKTPNLDEDDEGLLELEEMKEDSTLHQYVSNGNPVETKNASVQAKGRLPAGTLVVCPTSVLRQWAEELHNKVTSQASISVLVYHGCNRTKDPSELAKYDVVLTTYSIVSMEVPKQPLVDKDIDEERKPQAHVIPPIGHSSTEKIRNSSSSGKKSERDKEGGDSAVLESAARPLARVVWFRVVLDEAQSIKNHRTQVARACWGLHAKRRWCLSGTPIQNSVQDLYSYFRFLRYEPYGVYKFFYDTIKLPIVKDPAKGFRKLQAVLKTIMLRRTKGTLLDGEPIITLPPKTVELKKVDFSEEERDFYTKLEAESRSQFLEYAAAGTVKQNYVNILLMLLRLRQACDHTLLVKGSDSNYLRRSSIDVAKTLSWKTQASLLSCLEASVAICGICNDAPEDAVVTVCGHVFCNQCIYEHLIGDDNICPTTDCKASIKLSSVFSKATLNSCLSDHPDQGSSELVEMVESCSEADSHDSSKIRATLEVLQSLTKLRDCTKRDSFMINSMDGTTTCPESTGIGIPSRNEIPGDKTSSDSSNNFGEKAIVFSQWTKMLDLLEDCLKKSSIKYRRLDGTMSVVARDKAVKDFNTMPEITVMIMSLKAASLGLNMVAASHVLLLDLWWNPTTEDQAIDRAHRIGQTRPVKVLRLTVKNTVEDRILSLQEKKRKMVASAFGEDENGCRQTRLTVEDLNYLFMS